MMSLGFTLSAKKSISELFIPEEMRDEFLCKNCGTCFDYRKVPDRKLPVGRIGKIYDYFSTHDLRRIVSVKFHDICCNYIGNDDDFIKIKTTAGDMYYLHPVKCVRFDVARRGTRFDEPCALCGGYESIVGAVPAMLLPGERVDFGIYRTDLAFASAWEKSPVIIVDDKLKAILEKEKIKGVYFKKVT
jgi:hypothetical protein